MALKYFAGDKIFGDQTDTKPTNVNNGTTFIEWDTAESEVKFWLYYSGWQLLKIFKIDDSGTGVEDLWSASKLISELSNKVDKVAGKGLSTEDFTTTLKNKLDGLEGSKFVGQYASLANLQTAHPTADVGQYAYVDAGVGEPVQKYIWDSNDNEWTGPLTTGDQTPAQIKQLYEQNADTNAFTDSEKADVASNTAARHTQGTDDRLDAGGANEVSAADLADHLANHPETSPGGNPNAIQFNDGGAFGGSDDHIFDNTSKIRQVVGFDRIKEPATAIPAAAHNEGVRGVKTETVGVDEVVTHYLKRGDGVEVVISSYVHTP